MIADHSWVIEDHIFESSKWMIVAHIFITLGLMIVNDRGSWKKWSFPSLSAAKKKSWHLSDNTILFDFTCVKVLLPLFHLVKEWVYFWKSCQKVDGDDYFTRRGKAVKKWQHFSVLAHMFTSYRFYISESWEIAVKKCFFIFRRRRRKNAVNQKELITTHTKVDILQIAYWELRWSKF